MRIADRGGTCSEHATRLNADYARYQAIQLLKPGSIGCVRAQVATCSLASEEVPLPALRRFVNRAAGAIHRADPSARVTVGSHSLPYVSDAEARRGCAHEGHLEEA